MNEATEQMSDSVIFDVPDDFNERAINDEEVKLHAGIIKVATNPRLSPLEIAIMLRNKVKAMIDKITRDAKISNFLTACQQETNPGLTKECINDIRAFVNGILLQAAAEAVQSKMEIGNESKQ